MSAYSDHQVASFIVKDALIYMVDCPEVWVPTSVEVYDDHVEIGISVHIAAVDREVVENKMRQQEGEDATQG